MRIPYIKIRQKDEVFFIVKFKGSELLNRVNFHFREPYSNDLSTNVSFSDYIKKLEREGIDIIADDKGVQRRLQLTRIHQIKNYLEKEDAYFPTSVILSANIDDDTYLTKLLEETKDEEFGLLKLPDNVSFQIVDGQHRLAGLFTSDSNILNRFEISAVLLINATKNTCAKVFADINGNQVKVSKSVIYDLYDVRDVNNKDEVYMQELHNICYNLNVESVSPLYRHIKMLGVGQGAISQAFFIEYLKSSLCKVNDILSMQSIYSNIFSYLRCFQRIFKEYWPVLEKSQYSSMEQFRKYSEHVLKDNKSQILKTNGFGAILMLFPLVYNSIPNHEYKDYLAKLSALEGKIDWSKDEILIQGTGKKVQKALCDKMWTIIRNS